jgi:ABC-type bacteriocin/lantibiotic exporter with double-glycine peptidase domain
MGDNSALPLRQTFRLVLGGQTTYFWTAIIFGAAISLLALAVPVAVQLLIDSVANLGTVTPVVVLSLVLLLVLIVQGTLVAAQNYVLEMFERHFVARTAQEVTLRTAYAQALPFEARNREDLYNRFFEIDTIMSAVPVLIASGVNLMLQAAVGYVVVSFYHPYFLLVSVVHALLLFGIWRSVDAPAQRSAIDISTAKYSMGHWLESMAVKHRAFKSQAGIHWAIDRTDELTDNYTSAHKRHFRCTFTQTIGYQLLMAVGSALLLGVGGWLVVSGELTVGQLVAAELILGTIFLNMGGLPTVLESWYGMRAGLDKLAQLHRVPLEEVPDRGGHEPWDPSVVFDKVTIEYRHHPLRLNVTFPARSTSLVAPASESHVQAFCNLLLRLQPPKQGRILLGGRDAQVLDLHRLRDDVFIVDDARMFEGTAGGCLRLAAPGLTDEQLRELLDIVGLQDVIESLEHGLETALTPQGYPLTMSEVLCLRIAQGLALAPRLLVFTMICDLIDIERRRRILAYVRRLPNTTFVYMSYRFDLEGFDHYLRVGSDGTETFPHLDDLVSAERAGCPRAPPHTGNPLP